MMNNSKHNRLKLIPNKTGNTDFPIVGIGASAGGLDALEDFFKNVPKDCGMAFVVIQHLDPDYVGMMPELIQRATKMKVIQATDRLLVEPNHVYVLPPNKCMSILNGALHLFEPLGERWFRLPIDYFLRSLAEDRLENSISVILSGMGSDGSLGVKAIKEKNGLVLVQDPSDSKFKGMPRSAMLTVNVDITARASDLPLKLIDFLLHKPKITSNKDILHNKSSLEKVIIILRSKTGHDFSLYKENTLFRRIERRMNVHQISTMSLYVAYLQENPAEIEILFKELLIGVTRFFRDTDVWQELHDKIFPEMLKQLPSGYAMRAWLPGCSTGEEAYSLAMIFTEALKNVNNRKNFTLQIFATDLDSDAIEFARKAHYPSNIVSDVTPERINEFFTKDKTGFRINASIREMIVFAPHNVIKDPPFTKLDFLSCRNLLIYLEPELQRKLMALFHYSLNQDGIMLLGNAENENSNTGLFNIINSKLKMYKRAVATKPIEFDDFPSSFTYKKTSATETKPIVKVSDNIETLANQVLLQRFAPASVLINHQGDILYITGRTGNYLEPSAGKANMNIFAMARDGLRGNLMSAIRKAKQNFDPVFLKGIKVGTNGGTQIVDITIQQLDNPVAIKGTIIVIFNVVATFAEPLKAPVKSGKKTSNSSQLELTAKLKQAYEELECLREEMQTSQEELKSTNEELQSSNEELQSTNEELTTSKEEMQSLNEELQTVNTELQNKVSDFVQANNDIKNLLNSTDIATLFLDNNLNIRRFTDQITNLIKLRKSDIGRPFTEMVSVLQYPEIKEHAEEVLRTLVYKESIIPTNDERWFKVRIMPYRTFDEQINGLVITCIDFTDSEKLEAELKQTISILRKHNLYK